MLVLMRGKNEKIIIGNDIVITVVDCYGGKCRLGIEAPKEVSVHREEVYEAIKQENIKAKDCVTHEVSKGHTDQNRTLCCNMLVKDLPERDLVSYEQKYITCGKK